MASTTETKPVKNAPKHVPARLNRLYAEQYTKELQKDLKLSNIHQVPRLEKIVINVGLGQAKDDKHLMDVATNTLRKITGQQPNQTTAHKSIASFKLREGNKIGLKLTLRGERMYEFLDRLINIVLPRLRDFHGVSGRAFDKSGNYSIGLSDQSVFPELSYEETTTSHGLQVVLVIRGHDPTHTRALLEKFGMPFEKPQAEPVIKPVVRPVEEPKNDVAEESKTQTDDDKPIEEELKETIV
ncbi:MAG TPA: 50S ribosomal protein L5 [Candidatus Saccharimonadales bacterium]|nr:50S ribosomal protein L5 [Candidatus Saccharimonadales bacterium]